MHSDHIADLPDAHLASWIQGRSSPLKVYGPEGINLALSNSFGFGGTNGCIILGKV